MIGRRKEAMLLLYEGPLSTLSEIWEGFMIVSPARQVLFALE